MKVAVIIPVYDAARYVEQAVLSAHAQPQTAEVLLIEDGSNDDSLSICRELERRLPRVRVLQHPGGVNRGASASRNLGITSSTAEFIAFLDADDFMLKGRFEPAEARFLNNPSLDGIYDAVGTHLENREATDWWSRHRGNAMLTTMTQDLAPHELFAALLDGRHGWFCTDGIVARASLFERTGVFDTGLHMAEDTLMWHKMAATGELVGGSLDRPVAMRRVHGHNTIIRRHADAESQKRTMLLQLLRWCRRRPLRQSDREALIAALVRQIEAGRSSFDSSVPVRLARVWQCLTLLPAEPRARHDPNWRAAIAKASGWTGLRRRVAHR